MFAVVIAFNQLIDYHIGAAMIARSFSGYLDSFIKGMGFNTPAFLTSYNYNVIFSFNLTGSLLLSLLTLILCLGVKEGTLVNKLLTSVKIIIIAIVIVVGSLEFNDA